MNAKKAARKVLPKTATHLAEESYRKGRAAAVHLRYGYPADRLKVIAVTGTNGKTTTCLLINSILKSAGYKTALFTTAVIEFDGKPTVNTSHRTVPLTGDLFRFLKMAKDKKVDYVIMEVTSQALDQHKVWGIPIEVAVMTNLTQDHLDYHHTMQEYAAAKARLFNNYMKPKYAAFNRDDEWFSYFYKQSAAGTNLTYGEDKASDLRIIGSQLNADSSQVELAYNGEKIAYKTHLVGQFNVYNSAASAAVGLILGLKDTDISMGLASIEQVPGRMESINAGQNFAVIVDYAHAPDALKNALQALKEVTKGRVMVVFGATGNRDKLKRPIMGEIAAKYADKIFLTDDETYDEDGGVIRQEVMAGIVKAGGAGKTTEIGDRKDAIKAALATAKAGDTVLLAGIGHQDYRAMGGQKQPWDERDIARQLLKSR